MQFLGRKEHISSFEAVSETADSLARSQDGQRRYAPWSGLISMLGFDERISITSVMEAQGANRWSGRVRHSLT